MASFRSAWIADTSASNRASSGPILAAEPYGQLSSKAHQRWFARCSVRPTSASLPTNFPDVPVFLARNANTLARSANDGEAVTGYKVTAMQIKHRIKVFALASALSLPSVAPLHADVLFTFTEVGSDVVATTSGSIGTGWYSITSDTQVGSGTSFLGADILYGRSTAGGIRYYGLPNLFTLNNELSGVSGLIQSGSATGDFFGYNGDANFFTPTGVNEGESFSPDTTITWANETFASLGLDTSLSETPLVLFTLNNNDTISARVAASTGNSLSAIPEPSGFFVICGLLGSCLFLRLRVSR